MAGKPNKRPGSHKSVVYQETAGKQSSNCTDKLYCFNRIK